MTIALIILGYAACSIAAGYLAGFIEYDGGGFGASTAMIFSPIGLVLVVAFLAYEAGGRRAKLVARRRKLRLAELAAAEREVERLLSEGRR